LQNDILQIDLHKTAAQLMERRYFVEAAKITIPVLFGYLAIGIPFGLMIVNAGYPVWIAPIMSITMYAIYGVII